MNDNNIHSGRRLGEWIVSRGWSKAEFARRMEMKPQNVIRYLNGDVSIDNLAVRLMREGADINWLLTGEKTETASDAAMVALLKQMGINSPDQLQKLLDPEDLAKDIQQAVSTLMQQRRRKR
jgi:transcriptional regulator with XRE-family HTH domain